MIHVTVCIELSCQIQPHFIDEGKETLLLIGGVKGRVDYKAFLSLVPHQVSVNLKIVE